jgi:3-hydroxymyristoyl/3-hydroxydecanoyl-(acyl carrier protein) dehydratase
VKKRNPLWIMEGEVTVDGKLVASGTVTAAAA